uniref:Uncharacterized protein n=1 Tax=Lepeophtheirus salmonis TaxID=72036 RepID=A0A0K2UMY4_LEPSM
MAPEEGVSSTIYARGDKSSSIGNSYY